MDMTRRKDWQVYGGMMAKDKVETPSRTVILNVGLAPEERRPIVFVVTPQVYAARVGDEETAIKRRV